MTWTAAKELRFRDYVPEWFNRHARVRKSAAAQVRDDVDIRLRLLPAFGGMFLHEITTNQIDDFIAQLIAKGRLSRASVNLVLGLLKKMLNDAVRWGYLNANPAVRVEPVKTDPNHFGYWEKDEVSRFLDVAKDSRFYPVYLLGLNTGMRLGEIAALKWDRVNLETGVITVSRTYCMVAKAIKETTKGNKIRQVPIPDPLLVELRKLKERAVSDLVFATSEDRLLVSDELGKRHIKKLAKQAGVKIIRFHDLRHTYASHFVMNGGDLFQLKELLGHSDIKTTLRYAHFSPKHFLNSTRSVVSFGAEQKEDFGVSNVVPFRKSAHTIRTQADFSKPNLQ